MRSAPVSSMALILLWACSSENTDTARSTSALTSDRFWSGTLTYVDRSRHEFSGGDVVLSSTDDTRHAVTVSVNRNRAVMHAFYSTTHRAVSVHQGEPIPCMVQTVETNSGSGSGIVPAEFFVDVS